MAEDIITISHLTKDYGKGRGVFDISLSVHPGEVFGFLGTNGSGKTTTIRHMMGVLKSDGGHVRVRGLDPWHKAPELMQYVSYIPGEIAFPSLPTGSSFFKVQAGFLGTGDTEHAKELTKLLALDADANLKRMSKGMKQKTAIVAALMGDKEILILDEPTTGLDPLMRENFLELIREEKSQGHTVFMSSHIFEEIEDVCDRVAIIQNGHIREILDMSEFRHTSRRQMKIGFETETAAISFAGNWIGETTQHGVEIELTADPDETNELFHDLAGMPVVSLREHHMDLEEHFLELYHTPMEESV